MLAQFLGHPLPPSHPVWIYLGWFAIVTTPIIFTLIAATIITEWHDWKRFHLVAYHLFQFSVMAGFTVCMAIAYLALAQFI